MRGRAAAGIRTEGVRVPILTAPVKAGLEGDEGAVTRPVILAKGAGVALLGLAAAHTEIHLLEEWALPDVAVSECCARGNLAWTVAVYVSTPRPRMPI